MSEEEPGPSLRGCLWSRRHHTPQSLLLHAQQEPAQRAGRHVFAQVVRIFAVFVT
jgi:hypothetical protein